MLFCFCLFKLKNDVVIIDKKKTFLKREFGSLTRRTRKKATKRYIYSKL